MRAALSILVAVVIAGMGTAAAGELFTGEVNEPDVNIRVDSTVGAQVIGILRKGERVKVTAEAYDWYRIALPRTAPAYIHKDFILITDGQSAAKVLKNKVNVRLRPDIGSPILGQVEKGQTVEVARSSGDWIKIVPPPGASGWVNKSFVNRLADPPKEMAAVQPPQPAPDAAIQEILVVEGQLKKKVFTRVAPYKLLTKEGILYLVSGDTAELSKFRNGMVRVTGSLRAPYDDPPIIIAAKIEPAR